MAIEVIKHNVKFKRKDENGNVGYSPVFDLLVADKGSNYVAQLNDVISRIVNSAPEDVINIASNFCEGYSQQSGYNVGEYVLYGGKLYQCIAATTSGTWNNRRNNFQQITIGDELKNYKQLLFSLIKRATFSKTKIEGEWQVGYRGVLESDNSKQQANVYRSSAQGYENYRWIKIQCNSKDRFLIEKYKTSSTLRGFVFSDINDKTHPATSGWVKIVKGQQFNKIITVPEGARYLYVSKQLQEGEADDEYSCYYINPISDILNLIVSQYDNNKLYNIGDYVFYDNKLYKCKASTTGTWTPGNWDQMTNKETITQKISDLFNLTYYSKEYIFSTWSTGYYRITNEVPNRYTSGTGANCQCTVIECNENDKFLISSMVYGSSACGYIFTHEQQGQKTILDQSPTQSPSINVSNVILSAPTRATHLYISRTTTVANEAFNYKLNPIIEQNDYLASHYNTSQSGYNVGDYCNYNGKLWKCNTSINRNDGWDQSNWDNVTVMGVINTLNINLNNSLNNNINTVNSNFTSTYDSTGTQSYAVGDYCTYNNKLYKCKTAITNATTWDSSKWDEITVIGVINTLNNTINSVLSNTYDSSDTKDYVIGDYCIYNNKLYKCKTAINSAGDWDNTKWDEVIISEEIKTLQSKVNNLTADNITYDSSTTYSNNNTIGYAIQHKLDIPTGGNNGQVLSLDNETPTWTNLLDIRTSIAPIETSTSSQNYEQNDFFWINNKLYKATSTINQNDTIITTGAGANCVETSLSEIIKQLYPST